MSFAKWRPSCLGLIVLSSSRDVSRIQPIMYCHLFQVLGITEEEKFVITNTNREEIKDDESWGRYTSVESWLLQDV